MNYSLEPLKKSGPSICLNSNTELNVLPRFAKPGVINKTWAFRFNWERIY